MSDPSHDFDFFFGAWNVRHRRLKTRLAGSGEWLAFANVQRFRTMDDYLQVWPGHGAGSACGGGAGSCLERSGQSTPMSGKVSVAAGLVPAAAVAAPA